MLKSVNRYVRERLERKVISKAEKVENIAKPRPVRYYRHKSSLVPADVKSVCQNFNSNFVTFGNFADEQHNDDDKFKTTKCSDYSWIETFGWSGTLAFGWTLSQNVETRRKRLVEEILSLHYNTNIPLKSSLCPYTAVKNVLPKYVRTQPNEFLRAKLDGNETDGALPTFGPLTAEETLNEAKTGLEKARNTAIAEFENRMGLRCMSKKRYRRALVHFVAGSALQHSSATFNLAQCYELGLGTSKNLTKAAKCYQTSSEQGNATAMYNLAVYYAQGLGGLKCDMKKARELLEKAVERGEPHAKVALENRMKKADGKQQCTNNKNCEPNDGVLEQPIVYTNITCCQKMKMVKVTEMSSAQSATAASRTEKCTANDLRENAALSEKPPETPSKFSILGGKNYIEDTHKLPITFNDTVLLPKEFSYGFPIVLPLCTPKMNTVQGQ